MSIYRKSRRRVRSGLYSFLSDLRLEVSNLRTFAILRHPMSLIIQYVIEALRERFVSLMQHRLQSELRILCICFRGHHP